MRSTFVDYSRSIALRTPANRLERRRARSALEGRDLESLEGRVLLHSPGTPGFDEHVEVFGLFDKGGALRGAGARLLGHDRP